MRRVPPSLLLVLAVLLGGCSTAYYALIAQLGWARHDLLAHRVQLARDSQEEARVRFADALPLFTAAPTADAARLTALQTSYQACADSAALVHARLAAVDDAADALFAEWGEELANASGAQRVRLEQRSTTLRQHYDRLRAAMGDAEGAMAPVLGAMQARLAALERGGPVPAQPALVGDGDRLLRILTLAVALADQYVAELEALD
jgi:hypothetical protein